MFDARIFLQIYAGVLSISCQSTIYNQTNVPLSRHIETIETQTIFEYLEKIQIEIFLWICFQI